MIVALGSFFFGALAGVFIMCLLIAWMDDCGD